MPVEHDPISCNYVSQYITLTKNPAQLLCCAILCYQIITVIMSVPGYLKRCTELTYAIVDQ
jgi:hypothetical protein